jgi:hypothetical protein
MPIQGTVPVGGSFAPTDPADSFGTHNDKWGVGGYRIVKTITDRDAIPVNESNLLNLDDALASGRRKLGMMVYVSDEAKLYVLTIAQATWDGYTESQKVTALATNTNFVEFSGGDGGGGVDYYISTGTANTYTVSEITTYTAGDAYTIKFNVANTGTSTLNEKTLIDTKTQTNLVSGDIILNQTHLIVYDGTNFQVLTIGGGSDIAGGDLSGTYPDPTVAKIQGSSVSTTAPTNGQILQWNGTAWTPASVPTAGTGGGGVVYYLNFNTAADTPLTNIPQTPNTSKELGITGETTPTSYQSAHLSTGSYDFLASFVTDVSVPSSTIIPAGIWDFNIFAESSSTNAANQVYFKVEILKYSDANVLTSIATSSDVYIYDPEETNQYIASIIVPQTTLIETDRIVIYLYGRSHQSNKHLTFHFGGDYPSHVHTTLPSVTGNGLVKVVNGVFQSPATKLVDDDVAGSAGILVSKLSLGTANQVLRMPSVDGNPAWGAINLASSFAVTGTLAIGNGGTGFATYAIGDLLYADTTTSLAKLAGVATGSVLISGGVGVAPSWSNSPTLRSLTFNNASHANTLAIQTSATQSASYTLTFPVTAGSAGQYLQTNGSGVLSWVTGVSVGGVTTVSAFNASPQTNGATISSTTITFGPASATVPGMVSTGTQTWAGAKTLSSALTISATTSQLVLGTTNTTTITSPAPTASRTYTIPDIGASTASFVMTQGDQSITGIKTFNSNAGPIRFNDITNLAGPAAQATPASGTRVVIAPGDVGQTPLSFGISTSYEFWMAGRFQLTFYPRNQTTRVASFDFVNTGSGTTGLILSSDYTIAVPALRSTGWIFAAGANSGAAVSTGTRSAGTKIVLRDNIANTGDASIGTSESGGANTTEMWFTSPNRIAFYTGSDVTTNKLVITSTGVTITNNVGFYATAPQARASAYTQTYSATSTPNTAKTHSAKTAAALTNSTGGTVSTTLAAITAPASNVTTSLTADMTAVKNALASLADQVNKLRNDDLVVANLVNSIIDDLQTYGLFQ